MIGKNIQKQLFSIAFTLLVIICPAIYHNPSIVKAESIGVSPSSLNNTKLLQGSSFTQRFIISRSSPDNKQFVDIQLEAQGFAEWLSIQNGDEILLPKAEKRVPIDIEVNVPSDAQIGNYSGIIRFNLRNENEENEVKVVPGIRIDIKFAVSEKKIEDFEVRQVSIDNFSKNADFVLKIKGKNNGNIEKTLDSVSLEIESLTSDMTRSLETETEVVFEPFSLSTEEVNITDHGLDKGEYKTLIVIFADNKEVFKDDTIFKVFDSQILGETVSATSPEKKSSLWKVFILIGIALLILSFILLIFRERIISFVEKKYKDKS